jgi:aldose 1-epimerase
MGFQIEYVQQNGIDLIVLKDNLSGCYASVAPKHGALLHEYAITTGEGVFNVIDNYSNNKDLEANIATSYKSSKLSPFPCRINNARYLYEGQEFEFSNKFADGSAIHGLLFNKAFAVADEFADDNQASIMLKYNYKEEDDGYPFHYRCEIRYTLLPENILQLQTTIINLDDLVIPIADGWHPYFCLGDKIDNYTFCFNAKGMLEFSSQLLPTGQILPYDVFNEEKLIGQAVLDNCFLLNDSENYAVCTLRNPSNGLAINFFIDASYPYLQVYTPPHRNSIAIENLSGAPDCFNNKMGLIMLPPRHSQTFTVFYKLSHDN